MRVRVGSILRLLTLGATVFAGACTTVTVTEPPETATEQLLITTAIDNAVANMNIAIPAGTRIFVDTSYFDGVGRDQKVLFPKYAMAAIREKLLRSGALLAANRQSADMIVEARTGGQSVDHNSLFIGIPSISIPVPPTFYPVTTPELAFFKRDRQTGIAKLAIVAYRQDSGAYAASSGSSVGSSNHTETTILLVFDRITSDIEPKELQSRTH
jgi:hypothetical protein